MRMMFAVARAGFWRYSTYRQSVVAGAVTNTVFGCLRVSVLLAVAGGGLAAGYDRDQLSTYVWVSQGLLAVVLLWGWQDLADRVRTGEVTSDLLRPVNPIWSYLATDLGRAAFACGIRLLVPMVVGAVFFPFYWPRAVHTYPAFAVSVFFAVVVCFAVRYMINLTAFWLLDIRGVSAVWMLVSSFATGLYFPLDFLPGPAAVFMQYAVPFASIVQFPADVLVERGGTWGQLIRLSTQAMWMVVCLALAWAVQRRAIRKMVVQGG